MLVPSTRKREVCEYGKLTANKTVSESCPRFVRQKRSKNKLNENKEYKKSGCVTALFDIS